MAPIGSPRGLCDEIPMSRTLQTSDWETLDSMWGINMPKRYIFVHSPGCRARKKCTLSKVQVNASRHHPHNTVLLGLHS
jgi:hypothetical protein